MDAKFWVSFLIGATVRVERHAQDGTSTPALVKETMPWVTFQYLGKRVNGNNKLKSKIHLRSLNLWRILTKVTGLREVKDTVTEYSQVAHYGHPGHLDTFGVDVAYDWLDPREITHPHRAFLQNDQKAAVLKLLCTVLTIRIVREGSHRVQLAQVIVGDDLVSEKKDLHISLDKRCGLFIGRTVTLRLRMVRTLTCSSVFLYQCRQI
jgi:hypothetical protein